MRLTDTCQMLRNNRPIGDPRPCEFGHTGGDTGLESGNFRYVEQARVIVGPDDAIAMADDPRVYGVIHKSKTYQVTAILPRYRPGGRLHHVSLDLQAVTG